MSNRSAARGTAAASSMRLTLRTSNAVATSNASPSRCFLFCEGSRAARSARTAAATVSTPPIPKAPPNQRRSPPITSTFQAARVSDGCQGRLPVGNLSLLLTPPAALGGGNRPCLDGRIDIPGCSDRARAGSARRTGSRTRPLSRALAPDARAALLVDHGCGFRGVVPLRLLAHDRFGGPDNPNRLAPGHLSVPARGRQRLPDSVRDREGG